MDALDIRIMREMFRGGQDVLFVDRRKSLRNIAAALGVDKETVRARMSKLRMTGLLSGWVAVVNPNLLGVRQTVLLFEMASPQDKGALMPRLKQTPGLVLIGDFLGSSMLVILQHESEESLEAVQRSILAAGGANHLFRYENAFPPCQAVVTKTDWQILRILQKDPLRPFRSVAGELGISSRTVKRRVDRLVRGKALFAIPKLDIRAADGDVANLVVGYANHAERKVVDREILARLGDRVFRLDLNQRTHGLFMLILKNATEAKDVLIRIGGLSGVSRCRLDIFQDRIELWESYHDLLEKKLASLRAAV